ncbi:MAG: DUF3298 domain-containing protein [Paludibacter sp.]|nr:DUF3298 domain-containing protein [Paludibacter sp.]
MKRHFIILLFSILTSLIFFSCKQKTIKTDAKDYAKRYFLVSDTNKGSLKVEIHIEVPVAFTNKIILDSIRKTIITNLFRENYISHSNDSLVEIFSNELAVDYRLNNAPMINLLDSGSMYSFNNEHVLSGFSLLSDKNIYVYGIERYVYMGGAHGLETRNYINFNLKTGNVINESDLFVNNYKNELAELIKRRIIEESKETKNTKNSEPIISLEDTDFWTDSIKPNGNFYITDEGINYVFNPYEIAPYYLGETEVTIPFSRLTNLLKPNSPIAYLVEKQQ